MLLSRPVTWVRGGAVRKIVRGPKLYYRGLCYVILAYIIIPVEATGFWFGEGGNLG